MRAEMFPLLWPLRKKRMRVLSQRHQEHKGEENWRFNRRKSEDEKFFKPLMDTDEH